jgi:hypothetical protein
MADKNGKNATVKRPAVKAPGRVLQVRSTGRTDWRERQGSRAFLATSSLKPAHLAGRGGSPVIARLPTIQRIAGSRHSLSASFTSRSRPAVRTPTDECATSRYSDNVRRSGTKFADSPLEGDEFELMVPGLRDRQTLMGDGTAVVKTAADLSGNRKTLWGGRRGMATSSLHFLDGVPRCPSRMT